MKNKEVLLSLWDSYTQLVELKQIFKPKHELKMDEMKNYSYLYCMPDEETLKNLPMYNYYVNMHVPYVQKNSIDNALNVINETLSMIK